jgi:hypothetical protein
MYSHSVVNDFLAVVFVPQKAKIVAVVFFYLETIKHLLNVGSNGNLFFAVA